MLKNYFNLIVASYYDYGIILMRDNLRSHHRPRKAKMKDVKKEVRQDPKRDKQRDKKKVHKAVHVWKRSYDHDA